MLQVPHELGVKHLTGARARYAVGVILARVNRLGFGRADVDVATRLLTARADPEAFIQSTLRGKNMDLDLALVRQQLNSGRRGASAGVALASLPVLRRLALEMAVNEGSERRALEGELAQLEEAWREAEEVAAIADSLFVPRQVAERLEQLRRAVTGRGRR